MIRFSFNVYSARGHASGSGGDGGFIRGRGSALAVSHDELQERIELATIAFKSDRSKFIDEVLAKIKARSANVPSSEFDKGSREERQCQRKKCAA